MRVPSTRRQGGSRRQAQRGVAVFMTATTLVVLIASVGLAVDTSVAYSLKAKLSSAADAAAVAAARSLNVGMTLEAQEANAVARAEAFFEANFGHSQLITAVPTVNATVAETAARTRTVTVSASASAPQFFLSIFGLPPTTINAMGRASRRDVNLMIVLDQSGSMSGVPCTTMKAASTNFVNMFAQNRDRLGLITYGTSWKLAFEPDMDFKSGTSLTTRISQLNCGGSTSTATALSEAYNQIQIINEPGALNLIVIFTDGVPNGVTADFPVKKRTDRRYGYGNDGYNNNGSYYDMLPSTCTDADGDRYDRNSGAATPQFAAPNWNPNWTPGPKRGVLGSGASMSSTGNTTGPFKTESASVASANSGIIDDNAGCRFASSSQNMRRDIAYIPNTDVYGNSTTGYRTVATYPSGASPYFGFKRVDSPVALTNASLNTADAAASRIRNDATLGPIIYAIGLGDVDHEFLRRITNDLTSPIYDSTKPEGLYVYAPNPTDLNYAFSRIASEILRIAR